MPRQPKLKDTEVLLKNGQIWNCHPKSVCAANTTPCVFHSPTDHVTSMMPLQTRHDRSFRFNVTRNRPIESGVFSKPDDHIVVLLLLERRCEHGVGHPDPDCVAWLNSVYSNAWGVHGCDGCCREAHHDNGV